MVAERGRERAESGLVRDTLLAYYELWYAGRTVEIERAALTLAERQEREAREKIAQGALPKAGVLTFSTRVAELEEAVVSADIQRRERALGLEALMGVTESDPPDLVASSEPPAAEPRLTRADVERALLSVRIAEQNLKAARDRIGSEATLALASVDAARRRLALAEKTLAVAEESYEAERARFELAEVIPIAVQEAEDVLRRAKLRVARARVDLAEAHIDLLHLSGKLAPRYRTSAR